MRGGLREHISLITQRKRARIQNIGGIEDHIFIHVKKDKIIGLRSASKHILEHLRLNTNIVFDTNFHKLIQQRFQQ